MKNARVSKYRSDNMNVANRSVAGSKRSASAAQIRNFSFNSSKDDVR